MKIFFKYFAPFLFFIIILLAVVYFNGRNEFNEGLSFYKKNDFQNAALHFQRSVKWYIPFFSKSSPSIDYLFKIAEKMEKDEKDNESLIIYRRIRSAIIGIRWLFTPFKDELEGVNKKISFLMAKTDGKGVEGFNDRKEKYLKDLKKDFAPQSFLSFLAVSNFILWIISSILTIKYSFREDGKIIGKNLFKWGSISFLFLIAWLIAIRFS